MASKRQIKANRRNAKLSTGPKTEAGKAKSRHNAHLHGLSRPAPKLSDGGIRAAALKGFAEPDELVRARLDIARIYSARASLLAALLDQPRAKIAKALLGIGRYERKAFAKQRRMLREATKSQ